MNPVAIFQHTDIGHPGAVLTTLDALGVPWELVPIVDGAAVPSSVKGYSGLILMGGSMGVHDDLPWIAHEIRLVREAHAAGLPVAGHCLGSQLLAHAFGAAVRRNPRKEIGWQRIGLDPRPETSEWFGHAGGEHTVFQWHGDTFDLPAGAVRLATSRHCENQVFVLDGRHLAVQCHLEMTPELVVRSVRKNGHELDREVRDGNPAAGTREDTLRDLDARTAAMHAVLLPLYTRWARGLSRA